MKRKTVRVLGGALLSLALAAAMTACGDPVTEDESGGGDCKGKIGFMGALSGGNASIVIPSFNGAKLALAQFTEKNKDCKIELVEFDTEGDPAKAAPVANKIVADKTFLGVIGGAFSGETRQTKATFDAGGVTMISQSATATDLTTEAPAKVFHRVVGHDETQGAAIGKYLAEVLKAKKAFVVNDGTAYGAPLAKKVVETAGSVVTAQDTVQEKQTDFASTISKIKAAGADAVFYAGYANEAGPFLKQLRGAGVKAPFVGGDGLYGSDFPKAAGPQAEGAVVTCPCQPASKAGGTFVADYKAEYTEDPGAYAAEGYDAA
ncbi:MAG TPA: branched-chain amino acid ABC transporter substrate-binding protein, partial [Micromonosporaceae bacterium]|nr:branched-chain amino acid ABC transporter substrate-binding protein [Micromonosporaceae bacterium]